MVARLLWVWLWRVLVICIAKLCIPGAPIGGTATTPARATPTTDGFTMRLGFMA